MANVVTQAMQVQADRKREARQRYGEIVLRATEPQEGDAHVLVDVVESLGIDWRDVSRDVEAVANVRRFEAARDVAGNAMNAATAEVREAFKLKQEAEERAREFASTRLHPDRAAAQKAFTDAITAHERAQRNADAAAKRFREADEAYAVSRAALGRLSNP